MEAEVDWGRAEVRIAGVPIVVFLFLMRACFSGACFVAAYPRETQQAFLQVHVDAFDFYSVHPMMASQRSLREPLPIMVSADLLEQLHSGTHPFCDLRSVL